MVVVGGSRHHPGGLEAFCERATTAINNHAPGWSARWISTETAYFRTGLFGGVRDAWKEVSRLQNVDLVWLQWSTLLDLFFLWLAKRRGLKVLLTPHLGAGARLQRSAVLRRYCRRLLRRADRFGLLFAGQDQEIELPSDIPRSVVGTFLPPEAFGEAPLPREGRELRLLHAGRLSEAKGSFRMIELCRQLQESGVPFSAMIVGRADADTARAIRETIETSGLAERIALHDWMDGDTLRRTLQESDVLVHLSLLDSFPLIVLEAQIAGVTAIVADMAGTSNMVRSYGGFVAPGGDVAAAAHWLLKQKATSMRQSANDAASKVRHDYAWDVVARNVARIAEQTLPNAIQPSGPVC
jgi:glycosyltransferase involved in cell wall biosynthesis